MTHQIELFDSWLQCIDVEKMVYDCFKNQIVFYRVLEKGGFQVVFSLHTEENQRQAYMDCLVNKGMLAIKTKKERL